MAKTKQFQARNSQKLLRAVLVQAILDSLDPKSDEETRLDARDFLMTERSDFFIMAQGVSDVELFRHGMRARMSAPVVTVNAESGRHGVTFGPLHDGLKKAA